MNTTIIKRIDLVVNLFLVTKETTRQAFANCCRKKGLYRKLSPQCFIYLFINIKGRTKTIRTKIELWSHDGRETNLRGNKNLLQGVDCLAVHSLPGAGDIQVSNLKQSATDRNNGNRHQTEQRFTLHQQTPGSTRRTFIFTHENAGQIVTTLP